MCCSPGQLKLSPKAPFWDVLPRTGLRNTQTRSRNRLLAQAARPVWMIAVPTACHLNLICCSLATARSLQPAVSGPPFRRLKNKWTGRQAHKTALEAEIHCLNEPVAGIASVSTFLKEKLQKFKKRRCFSKKQSMRNSTDFR